jgi:hypothetical protein
MLWIIAHLQTKSTQETTQAELNLAHLGLQLFAGYEKSPHLLRRRRLAVDGAETTHAQELGDAARIAVVGL